MLEAIKQLGEYETEKEGSESVEQFIEKAKLKNIRKVICIVFEKDGKNVAYDHIHTEDYKSSEPINYLYRSHQSRQFDVTPTTKIAYNYSDKKAEVEKALNRIQYWFEKFLPHLENKKLDIDFLRLIKDEMSKNRSMILEEISKKSEELKKDEKMNSILTIKIKENGKEKYVGEFDVFKNILKEEGQRLIYYRHCVEIRGKGVCCLCGNEKEVYDYTPLQIYSVDKKGFAPEFIQKDAWKRLPVCDDCMPTLMAGGEFLNNYLLKNFLHNYKFYVIPHFIHGNIDGPLIEEIKRQEKNEGYEGLLIEDDYILDPIKERGDVLNLIFMFCEFGQSIKVVKYVEDVPPSWINKLYTTLEEINNLSIFKEETLKKIGLVSKKKSGDLKNIDKNGTRIGGLVEAFFPNSKTTGIYSKYFIDIIGDILAQRPINKDILINAFMREIRDRHVNKKDYEEKILILKSLMLLLFLNKVNLIKR
jgi:CRISPR-associated Csh1 family protein